jgi:putative oxidoreductase
MFQRLEAAEPWAIVILRMFLGFLFAMHGAQKLFGAFGGAGIAGTAAFFNKYGIVPGEFWVWVVAIVEFVGGLGLMAGFLTRIWASALVIDMTVAIVKVHLPNGFFWTRSGFEFPLTLAIMALTILLTGPSEVSVDKALGLERPHTKEAMR